MSDIRLTLFIGGPKDGEFMLINHDGHDAVYAPELTHGGIAARTYIFRKIGCPDGWTETVLVESSVKLSACTETELIGFVMTCWRARHAQRVSQ